MTPERWARVEAVYYAALAHDAADREAFLTEAAAGDAALHREVASLLAQQERATSLLETPALDVAARLMADAERESVIGRVLGAYEVLAPLGTGGMGDVYLARDRRLGRRVALKFLPPELAGHSAARQRFEREARLASALNHPNICTLYDIGEDKGRPFLVMELLEGQTLDRIIGGRPLAFDRVLDIALQIADALEAAHAEQIVHRDLKPGNLFVTERGQVKLLDFGVAKSANDATDSACHLLPTERSAGAPTDAGLTEAGSTPGTAAYMSPEQARGEKLDPRTDLFSFGVVLYEMATGAKPFSGSTPAAIVDAILHAPPVSALRINPTLPAGIEKVNARALEKERHARYQNAREMKNDLQDLKRPARTTAGHALRIAALTLVIGVSSGMSFHYLTAGARGRPADSSTRSAEAYRLYLKGRYHWNQRTDADLHQSVRYLEGAVQKDPFYAVAYSALADAYANLGSANILPPSEAYPKAKAAALKALEIAPEMGEARVALGFSHLLFGWDWPAAEREFKQAVSSNPSYATGHQWYGAYLIAVGRCDEAIGEVSKAAELEPISRINSVLAWTFSLCRQFDQAIAQSLATLEMDPNYAAAHMRLGEAYEQERMYDLAIRSLEKANALSPTFSTRASLGHAYARVGRRTDALKMLDELTTTSGSGYVPSFHRALIYVGLGDRERAFESLERALQDRYPWLLYLKNEARFDPLRDDPRFSDLLRRVGLEPIEQ